jgi:hypothetical protein
MQLPKRPQVPPPLLRSSHYVERPVDVERPVAQKLISYSCLG